MEFVAFRDRLRENFAHMTSNGSVLYEVDLDKDQLYNLYLDSFPAGTNELFRERREHDCSACRHFIKNMGNIVIIEDGAIRTIWDFDAQSTTYQPVIDALDAFVKRHKISNIFLTTERTIGTPYNIEPAADKFSPAMTWNHLYLDVPSYARFGGRGTLESAKAEARDRVQVFLRSLSTISGEAIDTVLELSRTKTLYKGEEWIPSLMAFRAHKAQFMEIPADDRRSLYAWTWALKEGISVAKIRNHSIGVLLVDLSEGMDLDAAVTKYERMTAPSNYKRPKAIFTKKMLEEAQQTVTELGYLNSLGRRHATIDDITINNLLFADRNVRPIINLAMDDPFGALASSLPENPKKFSKVETLSIEDFIEKVLPTTSSMEVYLEGSHTQNFVSLIAPKDSSAPSMFKWTNPFSWAYTGNMTDSMLKERVKSAGGKVDGDLRFSIQWNDTSEYSRNDLDAHCVGPGEHIFFGHKKDMWTKGELDVDIINPSDGVPAVENITWASRNTMSPGTYKFYVNQYCNRGGRDGFRAEIEFDGQIYSFDYPKELRQNENVPVAEVVLSKDGTFSIIPQLSASMASKEVWGLKTNQFIPVSAMMCSPNHWEGESGIGNKHYFFMLKGCVNPERPNGFYNEFLKPDLEKHRRVFEALGGKMAVEEVENQLSGIGFASTKRASIIVRVKGHTDRIFRIQF